MDVFKSFCKDLVFNSLYNIINKTYFQSKIISFYKILDVFEKTFKTKFTEMKIVLSIEEYKKRQYSRT